MNFKPEKIYLGKNSNGKPLRIEEWDFNTRAGVELSKTLVNVFSIVLFSQIISPLILIFLILGFDGKFKTSNIIGLLVGSYFLIDAYNGWIVTNFTRIFLNENIINLLIYLNAISILLHVFLLIFGPLFHKLLVKNVQTEQTCIDIFTIMICIIGVFGWFVTNNILKENIGWLNRNIKASIERNKDPQSIIKVEPSTNINNDGFFHDDPNYQKNQDVFYGIKNK